MARKKLFALVACDGDESLMDLKAILKGQGLEIWSARSCAEVARLLDQTQPELIFTATTLPDGTWADIVSLSETCVVPTNVIVVGKCKDTRLYLNTMDSGASDFLLPPFETEAVDHVVRVAGEQIRRQREAQAVRAVA